MGSTGRAPRRPRLEVGRRRPRRPAEGREHREGMLRGALGQRIEDKLADLVTRPRRSCRRTGSRCSRSRTRSRPTRPSRARTSRRCWSQRTGVTVDGTVYGDPEFIAQARGVPRGGGGRARRAHADRRDHARRWAGSTPPPVPEIPEPGRVAGYGYGQPAGLRRARRNGQGHQGPWHGSPGYGYPPPGGNGSTGGGGSAGYGGASGYPPPPPVPGWGRPTPDPDAPTQGYGPTQPGNGTPPSDNGQTSPAEWYPTEPLYRQPETGPVQVVGEPAVDTPPTGEPRVGEAQDDRSPGEVRSTVVRPTVVRPTVVRPAVGWPAVGRPAVVRPAVGPAKHGRATRTAKPTTARPPSPSRATTIGPARRRSPARPDRQSARALRSPVRHREGEPVGRAALARGSAAAAVNVHVEVNTSGVRS